MKHLRGWLLYEAHNQPVELIARFFGIQMILGNMSIYKVTSNRIVMEAISLKEIKMKK